MLDQIIKRIQEYFQPPSQTRPHCACKNNICAYCETEIAEVSAFAIAESLIQRARDIEKDNPGFADELRKLSKAIYDGSWYEKFTELITLEREYQ